MTERPALAPRLGIRMVTVALGITTLTASLFAVSGYVQGNVYRIDRLEEADDRRNQAITALSERIESLDEKIVDLTIAINRLTPAD